jgi:Domain of unknown function (DUF6965)
MPLPKITPVKWTETGNNVSKRQETLPKISTVEYPKKVESHSDDKSFNSWDISEMETQLLSCNLPEAPVKLDQCTLIADIHLFIETHLSIAKFQNGNPCYKPYWDRLNQLMSLLTINKN